MSLETDKLKSEIRNTCLVALTRREFSTKELKEKLRSRFDADGLIDIVLNELTAEKLLCDERYTESFVLARVNRGQGHHLHLHQYTLGERKLAYSSQRCLMN